jgi:hypothetical protein
LVPRIADQVSQGCHHADQNRHGQLQAANSHVCQDQDLSASVPKPGLTPPQWSCSPERIACRNEDSLENGRILHEMWPAAATLRGFGHKMGNLS